MINLPENYNIDDYDRPSVATDIAVFTIRKNPSESYRHLSETKFSVLMIKRKDEPYKDFLSLPGGFTVRTETIEQTAKRKLYEKTGVKDVPISLLYNSSAMGRDPRGWIISCAYWTLVESSQTALTEENAGMTGGTGPSPRADGKPEARERVTGAKGLRRPCPGAAARPHFDRGGPLFRPLPMGLPLTNRSL